MFFRSPRPPVEIELPVPSTVGVVSEQLFNDVNEVLPIGVMEIAVFDRRLQFVGHGRSEVLAGALAEIVRPEVERLLR